jgi:signal transduction histidine kinase
MKLAQKLALGLVLGITAVMGTYAAWQKGHEVVLFQSDVVPGRRGKLLLSTLRSVWQSDGEERARMLVEEVTSTFHWVSVRWIRVDGAEALALPPEARARIDEGEVYRVVQYTDDGMPERRYLVKLATDAPVVLDIRESLEREMVYVRHGRWATVAATLAIVVVCGLVAVLLGFRLVGRPVSLLHERAKRIGEGDLSTRLNLQQRDEIGDLAREIDAMCDRLEDANRRIAEETHARVIALEQLRHSDRLATVGQLAAGVAHELGTPLSVVSARAQLLASDHLSEAEVVENARVIAEQAARMTAIIRQLLDFSRRRSAQLAVADLRAVVHRTLDLLGTSARRHRVTVELVPAPRPLLARVDQAQIQQAVMNVVVNGIQAMTSGGRLVVRLLERDATPPAGFEGAPGAHACIEIEDEGPGIPPGELGRIFEPFFTTKPVGDGTGLGLSVSYGIVGEHGGWFEVESAVGRGTVFRIYLPLATGAGVEAAAS